MVTGYKFEKEIRNSLRKQADWWIRLPDFKDFLAGEPEALQHRSMPGDFVAMKQGSTYLIECKSSSKSSFPFRRITTGQLAGLKSCLKVKGLHGRLLLRLTSNRQTLAWCLTSKKLFDLMAYRKQAGFKSAKWPHVAHFGREMTRLPSAWDLSEVWRI